MRTSLLVVTMTVAIAACGTVPDGGSGTLPGQATTSLHQDSSSTRQELAIADLASHLDIDPSEIRVISDEDVSWSDGSVGCPEPGMSYTQAIVPGYLIVLEVDDTEYRYHGATDEDPFRCDRMPLNPVRP